MEACNWLVERWPTVEEVGEDWYPDSPSDLIYPCGAPTVDLPNGWYCEGGHAMALSDDPYDPRVFGRRALEILTLGKDPGDVEGHFYD